MNADDNIAYLRARTITMKRAPLLATLFILVTISMPYHVFAQTELTYNGAWVVAPDAYGLQFRLLNPEAGDVLHVVSVPNVSIDGNRTTWKLPSEFSLSMSPSRAYVAFIAQNKLDEVALFVVDLLDSIVSIYKTAYTNASNIITIWSPDSSFLLVSPLAVAENTLLLNVKTEQINTVSMSANVGLQWLPDSRHFIFTGPAVCGHSCGIDLDLYLGEVTGMQNTLPLTSLSAEQLLLPAAAQNRVLFIGQRTWHPGEHRIYFVLKQEPSADHVELLYSIDLENNLRFEADIGNLVANTRFPSTVIGLSGSFSDGKLYVITSSRLLENAYGRWTIWRYENSSFIEIYSRDFYSREELEGVLSYRISPTAQYIAIGSGSVQDNRSRLVIIDLIHSNALLDIDGFQAICSISWLTPTQVSFGQSDGACRLGANVQLADRIRIVDVLNGSEQIIDSWSGPVFLIGDDLPAYAMPINP